MFCSVCARPAAEFSLAIKKMSQFNSKHLAINDFRIIKIP
jgi:hypothetical protein